MVQHVSIDARVIQDLRERCDKSGEYGLSGGMVHAQAGLAQGVAGLHRFSSRLGTDAEPPRAESGLQRRGPLMRFQDDGSVTNGIRVPYLKLARTLKRTQKACGALDGVCCLTPPRVVPNVERTKSNARCQASNRSGLTQTCPSRT